MQMKKKNTNKSTWSDTSSTEKAANYNFHSHKLICQSVVFTQATAQQDVSVEYLKTNSMISVCICSENHLTAVTFDAPLMSLREDDFCILKRPPRQLAVEILIAFLSAHLIWI